MLDYLLTDGGLVVVAVWTLVFVFFAIVTLRGEWRRAHRISARRVEEVREYTRDFRIYVPEHWTKERSR